MKAKLKKKRSDAEWMELARLEALKAKGETSPNPIVGAVIVRNGRKLAKGFHRRAGLPHAEIEALHRVTNPRGATLYVTLEPCCHSGKRTPPCTDAILASGLKRVVVGVLDPNPKVSGRGVRALRKAGIRVDVGILAQSCAQLNPAYNYWMRTGLPWVTGKIASSLDGRIALKNGRSRWITGTASRKKVHELRGEVDAILVGIGTVLVDDPELNVRLRGKRHQPIKIVLDPNLKIPLKAKIFSSSAAPIWLVSSKQSSGKNKLNALKKAGAEILLAPVQKNGRFKLKELLRQLGARGVQSILVEGGPGVWTEFLMENCFDELHVFLAPKILGADARASFADLGLNDLKKSPSFHWLSAQPSDGDIHLIYSKHKA